MQLVLAAVALLCVDYPADTIWRSVLDGDDAALATVDLDAGPVRLLVERGTAGIEVSRLDLRDAASRLAAGATYFVPAPTAEPAFLAARMSSTAAASVQSAAIRLSVAPQ